MAPSGRMSKANFPQSGFPGSHQCFSEEISIRFPRRGRAGLLGNEAGACGNMPLSVRGVASGRPAGWCTSRLQVGCLTCRVSQGPRSDTRCPRPLPSARRPGRARRRGRAETCLCDNAARRAPCGRVGMSLGGRASPVSPYPSPRTQKRFV